MFQKIVSNLSFSPQVSSQLAFYAKRLRGERLTRRLSLVAGAIAIGMQIVAIAAPATNVNATGPNDIIQGGFTSKSMLIQTIDNSAELTALFHGYFHISDANINAASGITTIPAKGSQLLSLGRYRAYSTDKVITVGSHTYYMRTLGSVAISQNATAIHGTTDDGTYFAILTTCGNIEVAALPKPVAPPPPKPLSPPSLTVPVKTALPAAGYPANGAQVAPGATIGYRIAFTNTGQTAATNTFIEDPLPTHTTLTWQGSGAADAYGQVATAFPAHAAGPHTEWHWNSTLGGYYVDETVKVDANTPNGTVICNVAYLRSDQTGQTTSNQICNTVVVTLPKPPTPPPPVVTPPPAPPHISQFKSAVFLNRNDPQGKPLVADATTTANAGDVIEYTLKTSNTGQATQKAYQVTEDLSDILEYADATDLHGGTLTGAKLTYPATDLGGSTTTTNVFSITIKTPVPTTPQSISDSMSFDLKINNFYGNAITIPIAAPPAKVVEATTAQLPATGAGTDLIIMSALAAVIIYFYARNRQLVTEVAILRVEHNPGA